MSVTAASLSRPRSDGSAPFVPPGSYRGSLEDADYLEEEWFATGEEDGRPYATSALIRRPRDLERFSGTVIVEPLHVMSATPIWLYTSTYLLRSGHGWASISSQKTALDMHVKGFDPARYASLEIAADPPPPGAPEIDPFNPPIGQPEKQAAFFAELQRQNRASNTILAQVGAALRSFDGPFGDRVARTILAGHSQTGGVVTDFVQNGRSLHRLDDGSAVYDGFFPTGAARAPFTACDIPVLQVLSDGDIANPHNPMHADRQYRREDSDERTDRYRLYELAGVGHMNTRYPPYNDPAMWQQVSTAGAVATDARMNSLPHNELFNMALHHVVRWVADGVEPPRADRIEVGPDGYFAQDAQGNSRGGVRCAQMDVPRARYFSSPLDADGKPSFGVVGSEVSLDHARPSRRSTATTTTTRSASTPASTSSSARAGSWFKTPRTPAPRRPRPRCRNPPNEAPVLTCTFCAASSLPRAGRSPIAPGG